MYSDPLDLHAFGTADIHVRPASGEGTALPGVRFEESDDLECWREAAPSRSPAFEGEARFDPEEHARFLRLRLDPLPGAYARIHVTVRRVRPPVDPEADREGGAR
ncbi:MAG: hypothetical protein HUU06_07625 [Planctomycetaceae bacterium]|nr:hypothetical protein [Planctomycetota bacterium]NUN52640.1 hypothetical protein [Planctomycetaceae bacterium]